MAESETEQAPLVGRTPPSTLQAPDTIAWWRCWRYRTSLTAALGEAIVYGQRISVPIALVVMQAELNWTKETQGIVMTGFWIGYAAMQIPGGWLTTRWGARRVVGAGLCTSSVLHICMPMAARTSPAAMTALRVLQGISQGVMVPGYAVLWSTWAPPAERSRLSSIPQIGGYVGQIAQLVLAGWQIDQPVESGPLVFLGGWEAVFVLNSVLGLAWLVLWFAVVYDEPSQNARCPVAERDYIARALSMSASNNLQNSDSKEEPIEHSAWSWSLYKRMSRSRPVLAICAASFTHNIGNYMMIDGFPAYVRDVTGASMTSAGLASAVPQIAVAVLTTFGAVLADYLRGPRGPPLSTRAVRRLMHTLGTGCNAVLLLLVGLGALDGISDSLIVVVLSGAVGVAGLTVGGGFNVNHLDVRTTLRTAIDSIFHWSEPLLVRCLAANAHHAGTTYCCWVAPGGSKYVGQCGRRARAIYHGEAHRVP